MDKKPTIPIKYRIMNWYHQSFLHQFTVVEWTVLIGLGLVIMDWLLYD